MATLTYRTAGESHGPALLSILEGLPAGLQLDVEFINHELRRRQGGYGRGGRQRIETDAAIFLSGVRRGKTIGSPLVVQIANKDSRLDETPALIKPRPGHADLAGSVKWLSTDCRETLKRPAPAKLPIASRWAPFPAVCLISSASVSWVSSCRSVPSAPMLRLPRILMSCVKLSIKTKSIAPMPPPLKK